MFKFFTTQPGSGLFFMNEGDQGGGTSGNAGEGSGSANDQNSQKQTSGDGSGEDGSSTDGGASHPAQVSGGQSTVIAGAKTTDASGKELADLEQRYNKLAGSIRTNESKVKEARSNETKANEATAAVREERETERTRANAAEVKNMRLEKIMEAGIPGNLSKLVTADTPEAVDEQIKAIQTSLVGAGSTNDGNQSGTGDQGNQGNGQTQQGSGDGKSGDGSGQTQGTQDAGTQTGDQTQGDQGKQDQGQQTSQEGSAGKPEEKPVPAGYKAPDKKEGGSSDFITRFQNADGYDRSKLMQDVIEGKNVPDFGK